MTKDEAIKEIEEQSKHGIVGFQVLSVCDEDADEYLPTDLHAMWEKWTPEEKATWLSDVADDIKDVLEQHPDWGFKNLFLKAIECRQNDGEPL